MRFIIAALSRAPRAVPLAALCPACGLLYLADGEPAPWERDGISETAARRLLRECPDHPARFAVED